MEAQLNPLVSDYEYVPHIWTKLIRPSGVPMYIVEPANYTTTTVSTNHLDLTDLNHLLQLALTRALDTHIPRVDMLPSQQWRATPEQRCLGRARYSLHPWQKIALHRERQFGERLSLPSHRSWQLHLVPKSVERISPAATAHIL